MMKVMVIVKATESSEAGTLPTAQLLVDMGKYNEELAAAGILVSGDGLHPTARGKRIRFEADDLTVEDGPFTPASEQIAGFWVWNVESVEQAVSWALRCSNPMPGSNAVLEVRPFMGEDDLGENFTEELRERQRRLRASIEE